METGATGSWDDLMRCVDTAYSEQKIHTQSKIAKIYKDIFKIKRDLDQGVMLNGAVGSDSWASLIKRATGRDSVNTEKVNFWKALLTNQFPNGVGTQWSFKKAGQ